MQDLVSLVLARRRIDYCLAFRILDIDGRGILGRRDRIGVVADLALRISVRGASGEVPVAAHVVLRIHVEAPVRGNMPSAVCRGPSVGRHGRGYVEAVRPVAFGAAQGQLGEEEAFLALLLLAALEEVESIVFVEDVGRVQADVLEGRLGLGAHRIRVNPCEVVERLLGHEGRAGSVPFACSKVVADASYVCCGHVFVRGNALDQASRPGQVRVGVVEVREDEIRVYVLEGGTGLLALRGIVGDSRYAAEIPCEMVVEESAHEAGLGLELQFFLVAQSGNAVYVGEDGVAAVDTRVVCLPELAYAERTLVEGALFHLDAFAHGGGVADHVVARRVHQVYESLPVSASLAVCQSGNLMCVDRLVAAYQGHAHLRRVAVEVLWGRAGIGGSVEERRVFARDCRQEGCRRCGYDS